MGKNPTKTAKEQPTYNFRDVVLAKVRGFPPWPGMVVDPDSVPPDVAKERPSSKKTSFYCVRFFPAGDHAWLVSKDISKLQTHEIESYINEPYKRSGDLLKGYRIALNPTKWEAEVEAAGADAVEQDANAEVDQLESENEGENEDGKKAAGKSKKRKRESDAAPSQKTKAKSTKAKKDSSAEPAGKKKTGTKGKKVGAKSKAMVESEDDADRADDDGDDDDAGPSKKKSSPPPAKKHKPTKEGDDEVDAALASDPEALKVREWRHRLQKTFLSTKNLPKEEDMPALDQLFQTVEQYDKINIQYLTFSKIGKVMRHIALLTPDKVPRDDEFKFRDRANALVTKWHQILHENKPNGADNSGGGANGVVKSDGGAEHQESVVEGTAAMDLNGKTDQVEPATTTTSDVPIAEATTTADGDVSALGDVTMSEA